MHKCAFIGLGNMGLPMAQNLVRAGFEVRGFDLSEDALVAFAESGGQRAASIAACVEGADVVVTMLPSSPHVEKVIAGPNGVLDNVGPDCLLIEMSTIAPSVTRRVAAEAAGRGVALVDAPVSRGQAAAISGNLLIMAGGPDDAVKRARAVLEVLGDEIIHVGDTGSGAVTKLVNNMIVGSILAATAEGLVFGVRLGVQADAIVSVLRTASGGSWLLDNMYPRALRGDFSPGFFVQHMGKDLDLAIAEADTQALSTAMSRTARSLFSAVQEQGMGTLDCTAVLRHLEELADVEVRTTGKG
ncbi:NAD(P)-dependent oxidoreductase [Amycolatopsis jejuensis]|uniref:NAD(P)-dependent oxidoreductase n=1 Tax=Amycolatopsis jejuensis TaxID=330084 RepID=UPI000525AC21|nr:NAD(P)-dependent oxidoreductase [Amycolatopsis jejuensis]